MVQEGASISAQVCTLWRQPGCLCLTPPGLPPLTWGSSLPPPCHPLAVSSRGSLCKTTVCIPMCLVFYTTRRCVYITQGLSAPHLASPHTVGGSPGDKPPAGRALFWFAPRHCPGQGWERDASRPVASRCRSAVRAAAEWLSEGAFDHGCAESD